MDYAWNCLTHVCLFLLTKDYDVSAGVKEDRLAEIFSEEVGGSITGDVIKVRELWKDPWKTNTKELMVFLRVKQQAKLGNSGYEIMLDVKDPEVELQKLCDKLGCGVSGKLWGLVMGSTQSQKLI